jgi:hypothetical protein
LAPGLLYRRAGLAQALLVALLRFAICVALRAIGLALRPLNFASRLATGLVRLLTSIGFGLAIGVSSLLSGFLARGFGTPLVTWAWPILFIGLGIVFLLAQDTTGYVIGVVFILMGVPPLLIELRGSVQRVIIGIDSPTGVRYSEPANAKRSIMATGLPNPEGAVRPTILSWLLSIGITGGSIYLGYVVATLWFRSVSGM